MSATTIAPPSAAQEATNGTAHSRQPTGIIDCDVHHQYDKPDTLFPYLPRHYVEYIKDFGPMMPGIGYTNMPGSGARHDLWNESKINPATQPLLMPAGARRPFGNRHYHPIYEACERHGLPVCVHFGAEGAGISAPPTAAG